jgi:non-ribosomal peptide synthase protein (TIGR01720 family)
VGPSQSPLGRRSNLLDFNCAVLAGRLRVSCRYSENLHRRETIEGLAGGYLKALREILAHCRSQDATTFTPSDFPLARLDEKKLDQVSRLLERLDEA